jgi:hypothetical protein
VNTTDGSPQTNPDQPKKHSHQSKSAFSLLALIVIIVFGLMSLSLTFCLIYYGIKAYRERQFGSPENRLSAVATASNEAPSARNGHHPGHNGGVVEVSGDVPQPYPANQQIQLYQMYLENHGEKPSDLHYGKGNLNIDAHRTSLGRESNPNQPEKEDIDQKLANLNQDISNFEMETMLIQF